MAMSRRQLLGMLAALPLHGTETNGSLLLLSRETARRIKAGLPDTKPLRQQSAREQKRGPWSVTFQRPENLKVDPHDYYSEAPYWWPDPKNPGGPYIRRDGEVYPKRYDKNRRDLGEMCTAVLTLGMAAYFLDDASAAAHATSILNTWFLDAKTRMNPNLEFGQAIGGRNSGRGAGIIDSASFLQCVQGILLLEEARGLPAGTSTALHRWFADYLRWLTTSKKGTDEMHSGNNHSTWWSAQVAAYATFTGDTGAQNMVYDWYRKTLIREFQPDGSAPREEARTKSLGYTTFNLDAFSLLCRIAQVNGVDLWHYRTPQGFSIDTAVQYALPFVIEPARWKKEQIIEFDATKLVFPAYAAAAFQTPALWREYGEIRRADTPWVTLSAWIASVEKARTSPETPR